MQTIYCNWWDAEEPRKWTRDIDEQKSNQEKIRIRTLKTVGCGTRREKNGLSAEEALTVHSRQLKEQGGEKDLTQRAQRRRRGHREFESKGNFPSIPRESFPTSGQVRHNRDVRNR